MKRWLMPVLVFLVVPCVAFCQARGVAAALRSPKRRSGAAVGSIKAACKTASKSSARTGSTELRSGGGVVTGAVAPGRQGDLVDEFVAVGGQNGVGDVDDLRVSVERNLANHEH